MMIRMRIRRMIRRRIRRRRIKRKNTMTCYELVVDTTRNVADLSYHPSPREALI
jgi:hypothetical protein